MAASPRTVAELEHTVDTFPTNGHARVYLSYCYLQAKRLVDAEESYQKALALDPWQKDAWHFLAIRRAQAQQAAGEKSKPELVLLFEDITAQAVEDPLASARQMRSLAEMKGEILGKDPAGWLKERKKQVKEYASRGESDKALKLADETWNRVMASPFSTAGHVTRAALLQGAALEAAEQFGKAADRYEQVLKRSAYVRGAWSEDVTREHVEEHLVALYGKTGDREKADALRKQIDVRNEQARQPSPDRDLADTGQAIFWFITGSAILHGFALLPLCLVLSLVYGLVRIRARGQAMSRFPGWGVGAPIKVYLFLFLGLTIVASVLLVVAFGVEFSMFTDEGIVPCLVLCGVSAIATATWGARRLPVSTDEAPKEARISRRLRLRSSLGLLWKTFFISCAIAYTVFFIVFFLEVFWHL